MQRSDREQRLCQEPNVAEVNDLFELRVHLFEEIEVFRADEQRQPVRAFAADGAPDKLLDRLVVWGGNVVVEQRGLRVAAALRKEHGREVLVFQTGERKLTIALHRPDLWRLWSRR